MNEIGWKVDPENKAAYCIRENFSLSKEEMPLYSELMRNYSEIAAKSPYAAQNLPKTLHSLLKDICIARKNLLRLERGLLIEKIAAMNIAGLGVLDLLLGDETIEEISATGIDSPIRVYRRDAGWLDTNCYISSENFAVNAINKMARPLGRHITYKTPMLNAQLPDGSRLHASISPLNAGSFEITIRKFTKNPLSMPELIGKRAISLEAAAFLWMAAFSDISMLICGNTGSGKTTFLNALFSYIPMDERVIIAEETPEICILQPHRINLVANQSLKISMADLVQNTLRMRPDRVVVGEVRSRDETLALMESLQAGQAKGCYATFHAQDAKEAANRLAGFGILRDELSAIDLIVVLRRASVYDAGKKAHSEIRRVFEICEINGGKAAALFSYEPKGDSLRFYAHSFKKSSIMKKMMLNYRMDENGVLAEMNRRRAFLESLPPADAGYTRFTERAQEYMFGSRKLA